MPRSTNDRAHQALEAVAKAIGVPVGHYGSKPGLILDQVPMKRIYRLYMTTGDAWNLVSAGGLESTPRTIQQLFDLAATIREVDWLRAHPSQ